MAFGCLLILIKIEKNIYNRIHEVIAYFRHGHPPSRPDAMLRSAHRGTGTDDGAYHRVTETRQTSPAFCAIASRMVCVSFCRLGMALLAQ